MAHPQCCSNPPTLSPTSGAGAVIDGDIGGDIGGVRVYASGTADSKLAVVLVSDVYGFEAPNLRTLADKIAASGYYVVVPDLLCGDPFSADDAEKPFPVWIQSHSPEKGCEFAKSVIAALKSKGVSAIGAAGFCWGAKVLIQLAKSAEVQSAVLVHPSFVTVDDIKEAKCPVAVLGAENDHLSPPALVKQFEEALSAKSGVDSFVKIFPGVAHGWSVRYKIDDEPAVKAAEQSHQDILNWFAKTLKA